MIKDHEPQGRDQSGAAAASEGGLNPHGEELVDQRAAVPGLHQPQDVVRRANRGLPPSRRPVALASGPRAEPIVDLAPWQAYPEGAARRHPWEARQSPWEVRHSTLPLAFALVESRQGWWSRLWRSVGGRRRTPRSNPQRRRHALQRGGASVEAGSQRDTPSDPRDSHRPGGGGGAAGASRTTRSRPGQGVTNRTRRGRRSASPATSAIHSAWSRR